MVTVRQYIESAEGLRYIAQVWLQECKFLDFGIDVDIDIHLADLQRLIDSSTGTLFVLENEGVPVGYMGVNIFDSPLGHQKIANERYYYVLPQHRSPSSLKLIVATRRWAKENDCTHLIMNASNLASELHDKICKLYEMMGFQKFETSFICLL